MDLQETMDFIRRKYVFSEENYRDMRGMHAGQRIIFVIKHNLLHMVKATGSIATQCEASDHGEAANVDMLLAANVKMLINVLKLAEEMGLTAQQLLDEVPKYMKSK